MVIPKLTLKSVEFCEKTNAKTHHTELFQLGNDLNTAPVILRRAQVCSFFHLPSRRQRRLLETVEKAYDELKYISAVHMDPKIRQKFEHALPQTVCAFHPGEQPNNSNYNFTPAFHPQHRCVHRANYRKS